MSLQNYLEHSSVYHAADIRPVTYVMIDRFRQSSATSDTYPLSHSVASAYLSSTLASLLASSA